MAASQETFAPAWSIRLATDLSANDQTARNLVGGLTENSSMATGAGAVGASGSVWSISASPTNAICGRSPPHLGRSLFSRGGDHSGCWGAGYPQFAEPSRNSKRAFRSGKDQAGTRTDLSVLDRFLSGNQACRDLILRARRQTTVNRIRFWTRFFQDFDHGRDWTRDRCQPRTPASTAGKTSGKDSATSLASLLLPRPSLEFSPSLLN